MEQKHLARSDSDWRLTLMPSKGKTSVPCDYAKCKNRAGDFVVAVPSVRRGLNCVGQSRGRKFAMTDDPSPPAMAASPPERKQLTPAAKRALAEAEARRKAAE